MASSRGGRRYHPPGGPQGIDNRSFRLGDDLLRRLPAGDWYAHQVAKEQTWLPRLAPCCHFLSPVRRTRNPHHRLSVSLVEIPLDQRHHRRRSHHRLAPHRNPADLKTCYDRRSYVNGLLSEGSAVLGPARLASPRY